MRRQVVMAPSVNIVPGASVTGDRREIDYYVGSDIQFSFSWDVRNEGNLETLAGIRTTLISDLSPPAADASEFVSQASLAADTNALRMISGLDANYPKNINPGTKENLSATFHVSADELWKIQTKTRFLTGFKWWVLRLDIMDVLTGQTGAGDYGYEIRDWFKLVD